MREGQKTERKLFIVFSCAKFPDPGYLFRGNDEYGALAFPVKKMRNKVPEGQKVRRGQVFVYPLI